MCSIIFLKNSRNFFFFWIIRIIWLFELDDLIICCHNRMVYDVDGIPLLTIFFLVLLFQFMHFFFFLKLLFTVIWEICLVIEGKENSYTIWKIVTKSYHQCCRHRHHHSLSLVQEMMQKQRDSRDWQPEEVENKKSLLAVAPPELRVWDTISNFVVVVS